MYAAWSPTPNRTRAVTAANCPPVRTRGDAGNTSIASESSVRQRRYDISEAAKMDPKPRATRGMATPIETRSQTGASPQCTETISTSEIRAPIRTAGFLTRRTASTTASSLTTSHGATGVVPALAGSRVVVMQLRPGTRGLLNLREADKRLRLSVQSARRSLVAHPLPCTTPRRSAS